MLIISEEDILLCLNNGNQTRLFMYCVMVSHILILLDHHQVEMKNVAYCFDTFNVLVYLMVVY